MLSSLLDYCRLFDDGSDGRGFEAWRVEMARIKK
jgi:hypothetical protein